MGLDITWTITAIIAVSSFLSPIVVSILNNRHHIHIRKLEMVHDEKLRKMDLVQHSADRQFEMYYADKKAVFSDLVRVVGRYSAKREYASNYQEVQEAIGKALLFCDSKTQADLLDLENFLNKVAFQGSRSEEDRKKYSQELIKISISLNEELQRTKPAIDRE